MANRVASLGSASDMRCVGGWSGRILRARNWVRQLKQGYDYTGPLVRGRRGERFLALAWLDQIDEALILVLQDALSSSAGTRSWSSCLTRRLTRIP